MTRPKHPSISQVGSITDDGKTVHITKWGLGLCIDECGCHRSPIDGQLHLAEGRDASLGLSKFRPCQCCTPWTAPELAALCRDMKVATDLVAEDSEGAS